MTTSNVAAKATPGLINGDVDRNRSVAQSFVDRYLTTTSDSRAKLLRYEANRAIGSQLAA